MLKISNIRVGIDLSMRSTGMCFTKDNEIVDCYTITTEKSLNNEELLHFYFNRIKNDLLNYKNEIEHINLEGLSFNSISGSKDVIAGLFWYIRMMLYFEYNGKYNIVPVQSWRSPLFTKEERKLKQKYAELAKTETDKEQKKEYKKLSDYKYLTFLKLPFTFQEKLVNMNKTVGYSIYDMTDAYFLSVYRRK